MKRRALARFLPGCLLALAACEPAVREPSAPPRAAAYREVRPTFTRVEPRAGEEVPAPPGLVALAEELERGRREMASRAEFAPYFIAYHVSDLRGHSVGATNGALVHSQGNRVRALGVELRVGDYALDSSHPVDGNFAANGSEIEFVPTDDALPVLRRLAWVATDRAYREAGERFLAIKARASTKVDIEDASGDFTREPPVVHFAPPAKLELDVGSWENTLRRLSARFRDRAHVHSSSVELEARAVTRWVLNSEGTRIQTSETGYRVLISAAGRADDGMQLSRIETFDAASADRLPSAETLAGAIDRVSEDLDRLRRAPPADPYLGPAILVGRAAGVFFHEIFGHRMEGERQKSEEEGQTFAKKIGERVMPEYISVYDDPGLQRFEQFDLNGFYRFDDDGVPAQRASLVESGVLKGFLMGRVPVRGVNRSNGHGRAAMGAGATARQANLVVESARSVSMAELRRLLVAEAKRQGKGYGLLFADIEGGFTETDRFSTQGFKVIPVLVYRVFVDGRPDELIRGVDIIGTPLTALTTILAAGDDYDVFNGSCGAESGWVPVSAISPSLLVQRLEVALRDKESDKPPVLPPPGASGARRDCRVGCWGPDPNNSSPQGLAEREGEGAVRSAP